MCYWRLVYLTLLLLTEVINDNFANKSHQGKQIVAQTACDTQTVCNNICARIYDVTQTKSAWEATKVSSALQVSTSLWKIFCTRAGEVEIVSLLVHTEAQHDQWVVLARHSQITNIADEAATGHSRASAQLHRVVAMGVSSWVSDVQGMCSMALKHMWIVLMIGEDLFFFF